jgi:hypothetical protein
MVAEPIIALPDHTTCQLPHWMLDEHYCAALVDGDQPLIVIGRLCALADLLDCQPKGGCISVHEKAPRSRNKNDPPSANSAAAPVSERAIFAASHDSPGVPGVAGGNAHHSREQRNRKNTP